MQDSTLKAIGDHLESLHKAIEETVIGLPDEAMDWSPGPEMNSIGVLLVHTMGSERYWIGDVAGQDDSGRDREAEFRSSGTGTAELVERSRQTLSHSLSVLNRLSPDQFQQERTAPLTGRVVTVYWALAHALKHTAEHKGHIDITRQMWDMRKAPELS
jgi:uncharacterized damage-inducible protein DinB